MQQKKKMKKVKKGIKKQTNKKNRPTLTPNQLGKMARPTHANAKCIQHCVNVIWCVHFIVLVYFLHVSSVLPLSAKCLMGTQENKTEIKFLVPRPVSVSCFSTYSVYVALNSLVLISTNSSQQHQTNRTIGLFQAAIFFPQLGVKLLPVNGQFLYQQWWRATSLLFSRSLTLINIPKIVDRGVKLFHEQYYGGNVRCQ